MTDNLASMEIREIYQGVRLASKLLSKISPDIKSPTVSRKHNNDGITHGDVEIESECKVGYDNKRNTTLQKRVDEVNSMQLSIQRSTQFFNSFVVQWVLGDCEQTLTSGADEIAGGREEEQSCTHDIVASTFAASCRYLVEIACFPCWKPVLIVEESGGKSCSFMYLFFYIYSFLLSLLIWYRSFFSVLECN